MLCVFISVDYEVTLESHGLETVSEEYAVLVFQADNNVMALYTLYTVK